MTERQTQYLVLVSRRQFSYAFLPNYYYPELIIQGDSQKYLFSETGNQHFDVINLLGSHQMTASKYSTMQGKILIQDE